MEFVWNTLIFCTSVYPVTLEGNVGENNGSFYIIETALCLVFSFIMYRVSIVEIVHTERYHLVQCEVRKTVTCYLPSANFVPALFKCRDWRGGFSGACDWDPQEISTQPFPNISYQRTEVSALKCHGHGATRNFLAKSLHYSRAMLRLSVTYRYALWMLESCCCESRVVHESDPSSRCLQDSCAAKALSFTPPIAAVCFDCDTSGNRCYTKKDGEWLVVFSIFSQNTPTYVRFANADEASEQCIELCSLVVPVLFLHGQKEVEREHFIYLPRDHRDKYIRLLHHNRECGNSNSSLDERHMIKEYSMGYDRQITWSDKDVIIHNLGFRVYQLGV